MITHKYSAVIPWFAKFIVGELTIPPSVTSRTASWFVGDLSSKARSQRHWHPREKEWILALSGCQLTATADMASTSRCRPSQSKTIRALVAADHGRRDVSASTLQRQRQHDLDRPFDTHVLESTPDISPCGTPRQTMDLKDDVNIALCAQALCGPIWTWSHYRTVVRDHQH